MHDTAFKIGSKFISTYASPQHRVIVDVGSLDVNGSLRTSCPEHCLYIGIDIEHGDGVDIKIDPSRPLPLRNAWSDLTISTSQMEHDPKFWMTFLELCRITRPGGFLYLSAPSNGTFHRYPVDVWRFYPDAGAALSDWARENNFEITLLESFTAPREADIWNDFVALFYMGNWSPDNPIDFLSDHFGGYNARKFGYATIQNEKLVPEDQALLNASFAERDRLIADIERLKTELAELAKEHERLSLAAHSDSRSVDDAPLAVEPTSGMDDRDL